MPTLAQATLREEERRVIEHFVEALRERLGGRLRSVWLYGSRARGEEPGPESDVDLLVVSDGGLNDDGSIVNEVMFNAAWDAGQDPFSFSTIVWDPDWLRRRREIRSFFAQEVDRDKIVLYGEG